MTDLCIVGAGPAGMTAALYALRAGKSVILLERDCVGGQITASERVDNYPGLPGVNGYDFAFSLQDQILKLGAVIESREAVGIRETEGIPTVLTSDGEEFDARAVIIASGLSHRKLGLPGEEALIGKGVSFCAVCDGGLYRGKDAAVVGGGSTAVQDALYLSGICGKVTLIHRRRQFRAENTLLEQMKNTGNIEILTDCVVSELLGSPRLSGIRIRNVITGETRELPVSCLFEAVGQVPNNQAFREFLPLDPDGYAASGESCRTDVPWLFAAGDCRAKEFRQLTTAVADGTVAASAAIAFLEKRGNSQ